MTENIKILAQKLFTAKNPLIMSGAGISAESNIPTFRGAGGFWKKWESTSLATGLGFFGEEICELFYVLELFSRLF